MELPFLFAFSATLSWACGAPVLWNRAGHVMCWACGAATGDLLLSGSMWVHVGSFMDKCRTCSRSVFFRVAWDPF